MKTSATLSDQTELPAELLRSAPRHVERTAAGKALAALMVFLIAGAHVAGVLLYLAATADAEWWEKVRREAVATQGEVVQVRRTGGKNPRRVVTYRYEAGGEWRSGQARFRIRESRSLEAGSRVPVWYAASTPELSWVPGHEPRRLPFFLVLLVPASLVAGALGIAYALRQQRKFLAEGRAAVAHVTRSERKQHKRTFYRVHYVFTLLSGAGCSGHYDVTTKSPPSEGWRLIVLYDSETPRRQARYPLSLVRVALRQ